MAEGFAGSEGILQALDEEVRSFFELILGQLINHHYECSAFYMLKAALNVDSVDPSSCVEKANKIVKIAGQESKADLNTIQLFPVDWYDTDRSRSPSLQTLSNEIAQLFTVMFAVVLRDHAEDEGFWTFLEYLLVQYRRQDLVAYYLLNECFFVDHPEALSAE